MKLTGPTNAVELVRVEAMRHVIHFRDKRGFFWTVCRLRYAPTRETILASPADIRQGFVPNLCPRCVPCPKEFGKEAKP